MTDLFTTWFDIAIREAETRVQAVIDQSYAVAKARTRIAFEHDRRSLAQRLRSDRIQPPLSKGKP